MTKQERVIDVIEQMSGSKVKLITSIESLSIDSLDMVEIVHELEEEFNTKLNDVDIQNAKTVADFVELV